MKLPAGLLRVLVLFVIDQIVARGVTGDVAALGQCCGSLARAWAIENPVACEVYGLDLRGAESVGARLGKYLGEFFLSEGKV